tara:strand:+ start:27102 stop:27461 length:360 start_codon:yes stop_codon:yes gene_type:complete
MEKNKIEETLLSIQKLSDLSNTQVAVIHAKMEQYDRDQVYVREHLNKIRDSMPANIVENAKLISAQKQLDTTMNKMTDSYELLCKDVGINTIFRKVSVWILGVLVVSVVGTISKVFKWT